MGSCDVPFTTENGNAKKTTFLNAPVAMPNTSMHGWNKQGHRTLLGEHAGVTVHKDTDADDPVIVRNGAYFLKMYVSDSIAGRPQGFARHGP